MLKQALGTVKARRNQNRIIAAHPCPKVAELLAATAPMLFLGLLSILSKLVLQLLLGKGLVCPTFVSNC